ncbi:MAG: histidine triad nucleotide-binding protein [Clostridia bacterium]|nr:histidine triad nucleotide-binding protein [Eubacteriales bacterium]MDD3867122.1 histidine triad nucleotide-binding protein [Eubacteriales bacterium]MDD4460902.1 histidine triad nucleotide-binding protein [Eubacteriales bacterium]NCC47670.1 histidine triad nucleotide-binding protein [Clostridia bacterium]
MDDCLFCKIINGDIPSEKIYEDEHVIAFYDIHPAAPVHVLVVPRRHFRDLPDMMISDTSGLLAGAVLSAVTAIARQLGVSDDGFRLINNCGVNGGQTIPHVHFHLLAGRKMDEKLL